MILFALVTSSACSAVSLLQPAARVPVPSLLGKGGALTPLSTNVKDARTYEKWLEVVDPSRRAASQELFGAIPANLGPGYFRIKLKSFCLHAGAPAASQGEGYGLAPYKGVRADVLRNVVTRSARHPELAQSDVQRLLWEIEYGHKYEELRDNPAAALLDASDIATMTFDGEGLQAFAKVSFGANFDLFGSKLVDPNVPFEDLARLAVPSAPPPANLGPSHWTFVGRGLYARETSSSYRETVVELYRPRPFEVERDAQNHIVSITSGDTRATIRTDRHLGRGVAYRDLSTGHEFFIPESVLGNAPPAARPTAMRASNAALFGFPEASSTDSPLGELYETYKSVKELKEKYGELKDDYEAISRALEYAQQKNDPASLETRGHNALDVMATDEYMQELLKAGVSFDLKEKGKALQKHFYNLTDVWRYVICTLRGQCSPSDGSAKGNDGDAATGFVAVPYDTGRQRLGVSNAAFGE